MRTILAAIICILLVAQIAMASESSSDEKPLDIQSQVEMLQKQLEELRKEYSEAISELERKIEELKSKDRGGEEVEIRRAAEEAAGTIEEETPEEVSEETVFKSGALGLQALNPEISVDVDAVSWYGDSEEEPGRLDFGLREFGIHFESYLDPYSKFKSSFSLEEEGAELEEAYMTRYDIGKSLNMTIGKFHQQFGIVNRWHLPALDQVDFPLALRNIFGGPLESTGVSFDWLMPKFGNSTQMLTFQLTRGSNYRLFGQNSTNFPSLLVHYKNYRDISKDLYFEAGFTSLVGRNDEWQLTPPTDIDMPLTKTDRLWTTAYGFDFTLLWEPTEAMRYRNWVWRTEGYFLRKRLLPPDDSGPDTLKAWGLYSYFQSKISRTTEVGARLDYYKPDVKSYADAPELLLSPLAVTTSGAHQWQISPYITWWQSEWVKWRFEYNHRWGRGFPSDDRLFVQCTFAAGPHKHERY